MSEVIAKPNAKPAGRTRGSLNRDLIGTVTFKPQRQPAKPVTRALRVVSEYEPAGDQPTAIRRPLGGRCSRMSGTRCCWASPAPARLSPWPS